MEREIIQQQLEQLGLRQTSCGFAYLTRAAEIAVADPSAIFDRKICGQLYPAIATEYHTSAAAVEIGIRRTLAELWRHGDRNAFLQIAGHSLQRKPTNCEFIAMMAEWVNARVEQENEEEV